MLRNPCGWAWRRFVAFLLLCFVFGPAARGGPINSPPPYLTAGPYTLSGNVYQQDTGSGVSDVSVTLVEYSPHVSITVPVDSFTTSTSSSGSYNFGNLVAGDFYTLLVTPPAGYATTANDTIGSFVSATGGSLEPPTAFYPAPPVYNYPANGTQYSSAPGMMFYVNMPKPTGAFAPSADGGKYSAVNYNFVLAPLGTSSPPPNSSLYVLYGGPTTPIVVPSAAGGLLLGASVSLESRFFVANTNPNSGQSTEYYIGGSSPPGDSVPAIGDINSPADTGTRGQNVGTIGLTSTLFSASGSYTNVPVTIGTSALGPISGTAQVSVSDTGGAQYAPLVLGYQIVNVGYAATGGVDSTNPNHQLFGAQLSADIPAGASIGSVSCGSLSSIVALAGTSGSNSVALAPPAPNTILSSFPRIADNTNLGPANYEGTVGSECDILASTAFTSSTTVTMSWRNRNNAENGSFLDSSYSTILPPGILALTSDVVDVEGVGTRGASGNPTYAVQMTYDDRINSYVSGSSGSATVAGVYLVKLVNGVWENAVLDNVMIDADTGSHAQTAVADSLSDFLTTEENQGYTLDELAGSWGVDSATDQAWAILNNGGGDLAVVPEPSSLVLLGAAAAGLLVARVRRNKNRR